MEVLQYILLVVLFLRPEYCTSEDTCHPCVCYTGIFPMEIYGMEDQLSMQCADCASRAMSSLPSQGLPYTTTFLDLSDNRLNHFPDLRQLTELQYLLLANNSIQSLCGDELDGVSREIVYLDLLGNPLNTPCLHHFKKLTTLKLETGELGRIFDNVTQLYELHLVTSAARLPGNLLHPLVELRSVYLEVSECKLLPNSLFDSEAMANNLESLVIVGPKLQIEDRKLLMNLTKLRTVHIALSNASIPRDIFYEKESDGHRAYRFYLEEITLEGMQDLPPGMLQYLPMLQKLTISGFKSIPPNLIDPSESLKELKLSDSEMTSLPTTLFEMNEPLLHLDLSHNQLTSLNAELSKLVKLKSLNLSHNKLRSVPSETFDSFRGSLISLDLTYNPMCEVPDNLLTGFNMLQELHIDLSCLTHVPVSFFRDLTTLKNLWITVNDTRIIPVSAFEDLLTLEQVTINNLQLVGLEGAHYQRIKSSDPIDIDSEGIIPSFGIPDNGHQYCLVYSGGERCSCLRGDYVVTILGGNDAESYCINEEHLPFNLYMTCDENPHPTTMSTTLPPATTTSTTPTTTTTTPTTTTTTPTTTTPTTTATTTTISPATTLTTHSTTSSDSAVVVMPEVIPTKNWIKHVPTLDLNEVETENTGADEDEDEHSLDESEGNDLLYSDSETDRDENENHDIDQVSRITPHSAHQSISTESTTPPPAHIPTRRKYAKHAKGRFQTTRYIVTTTTSTMHARRSDQPDQGVDDNPEKGDIKVISWAIPVALGILLLLVVPIIVWACCLVRRKHKDDKRFRKKQSLLLGDTDGYLSMSPHLSPPPTIQSARASRPSIDRRADTPYMGWQSIKRSIGEPETMLRSGVRRSIAIPETNMGAPDISGSLLDRRASLVGSGVRRSVAMLMDPIPETPMDAPDISGSLLDRRASLVGSRFDYRPSITPSRLDYRPSISMSMKDAVAASMLDQRPSITPSMFNPRASVSLPMEEQDIPVSLMNQRPSIAASLLDHRPSINSRMMRPSPRLSRMSLDYGASLPSSLERRGSIFSYRSPERRESVFNQAADYSSRRLSIPRPSIST